MAIYGYARVSTIDQDLQIQRKALEQAGCTVIRAEKVSGTKREGRVELENLLQFIREGDTLVVTRIDRLARSIVDLKNIVATIEAKGAHLKAIDQEFGTGPFGKMTLGILGVFAEFETDIRRERQLEGIAQAKEADKSKPAKERKYRGRKATIDADKIRELQADGVTSATEIARKLGIARASVYRLLGGSKDRAPNQ